MSVHYKFKSTTTYDAIKFDGVYITASDLKSIISQQKKTNTELQVENEETGQIYSDDQLIPKNTNVIVTRLPPSSSNRRTRIQANQPYPARFSNNSHSAGNVVASATGNGSIGGLSGNPSGSIDNKYNSRLHNNNNSHHNNIRHTSTLNHINSSSLSGATSDNGNGSREALELVSTKNMSEAEKIKYIQSQSAKDFDIASYRRGTRGMGSGGRGRHHVSSSYTCKKCGIPGHHIADCKGLPKVKRSSGIPQAHLMIVDSKTKGAMMTPSGEYAVPIIHMEAYNNPKIEKAPFAEDGTPNDDNLSALTTTKTS